MRYARQEILPEIGAAGQAQLQSSHAVIVGVGGLGCPALQYLVAAGLGRITIVDGDTISLTNLHRQTLYREDQTGALKADIAVETLRRLNSDCALKSVPHALTPANAEALLADANIILDCADSFAVSYILSDVCEEKCLPLISASALEFNGYVGGFCGGSPSLRAVFPDLPERAATCATAGVLGPVVGTIGAMQAQMAIAQILGLEPAPLGQLVTLDLRNYRFGGFRFDNASEPTEMRLRFIAPHDINGNDFIVELRDEEEASRPVSPSANRHRVDDFGPNGPIPNDGQRAVLCCRSGLRSWQAARRLQTYWSGEISLIAMGNTPETSSKSHLKGTQ